MNIFYRLQVVCSKVPFLFWKKVSSCSSSNYQTTILKSSPDENSRPINYPSEAWPDRHVGAPGRLVIWRPFKQIFFKYLFNISSVGAGRNRFILAFTFRQLCKELCVQTQVNWQHIYDLFKWCFSALIGWWPRQLPLNPALFRGLHK
jgi:hypothetical protein